MTDGTGARADALTPERIARLRQLHEAGTPGPWEHGAGPYGWDIEANGELIAEVADEDSKPRSLGDAKLIAEARNALPELLAAYEREHGDVVMWARMYVDGIRSWRRMCMELFDRVADGASLERVVDLVGDYLDGQDVVDDESIAAFNAAKDACAETPSDAEASTEAPPSPRRPDARLAWAAAALDLALAEGRGDDEVTSDDARAACVVFDGLAAEGWLPESFSSDALLRVGEFTPADPDQDNGPDWLTAEDYERIANYDPSPEFTEAETP